MAGQGSKELLPGDSGTEISSGSPGYLLVDVAGFVALVHSCFTKASQGYKRSQIKKILNVQDWIEHYRDKDTGRRVLAECELDYEHEKSTAMFLAQMNYDVVFAPKGMFKRSDKKFDVFLLRDVSIVRADLKSVSSKNPDHVANRIREGSEQASRVVVHILSDIERKKLIDALQKSVVRNKLLKEIFLIYKRRLYRLPKHIILSPRIFEIIK